MLSFFTDSSNFSFIFAMKLLDEKKLHIKKQEEQKKAAEKSRLATAALELIKRKKLEASSTSNTLAHIPKKLTSHSAPVSKSTDPTVHQKKISSDISQEKAGGISKTSNKNAHASSSSTFLNNSKSSTNKNAAPSTTLKNPPKSVNKSGPDKSSANKVGESKTVPKPLTSAKHAPAKPKLTYEEILRLADQNKSNQNNSSVKASAKLTQIAIPSVTKPESHKVAASANDQRLYSYCLNVFLNFTLSRTIYSFHSFIQLF